MISDNDSYYQNNALESLPGVGKRYAQILKELGFNTLFDICFDIPFRYLDKTKITPIAAVLEEEHYYLIKARVLATHNLKGKVLKVSLTDDSGKIEAVFFNSLPYFTNKLVLNQEVMLFGLSKRDYYGRLCLQHPQITFLQNGQEPAPETALTPIYHLAETLPQQNLRKIITTVTSRLHALPLEELLTPDENPFSLSLTEAILAVHAPLPPEDGSEFNLFATEAFKRICYEELLAYQLTLLQLKDNNLLHKAESIAIDPQIEQKLIESLPFKLTDGQLNAYKEICTDLNKTVPMLRLLQGDVGSGKTLVAIMACLQVCRNGRQCVLLAPTELLAIQHYKSFQKFLSSFAVNIVLLHSSLPQNQRLQILKEIANGSANIIIGTHSVFQENVKYLNLALAVIDEQHRFGLEQRASLLKKAPKGKSLHQLVMTATPIPRTLQLAIYSNLDVSSIYDKPPGRKKITTVMVLDRRRHELISHLRNVCEVGQQVYWVCPLIGEHAEDQSSAQSVFKEISRSLPDIKCALLHGQLKPAQKQQVMDDFIKNKIQILVATTIVEVGVDVPNASVIIIDGAQRLGLAQLHQLRGRVGRGQIQGSCVLLYNVPEDDPKAAALIQERLQVIKNNDDGFKIAENDLKLRGPGEVIGTAQSGFNFMRVADIVRDHELLKLAHQNASILKKQDPKRALALVKRWFYKMGA